MFGVMISLEPWNPTSFQPWEGNDVAQWDILAIFGSNYKIQILYIQIKFFELQNLWKFILGPNCCGFFMSQKVDILPTVQRLG